MAESKLTTPDFDQDNDGHRHDNAMLASSPACCAWSGYSLAWGI